MGAFSDNFGDKRILVIGHSGFKGSWLTLALLEAGAKIWGYSLAAPADRRHAFHQFGISDRVTNGGSQFGDVRDFADLKQAYDAACPDLVLHVAAQALVSEGYRDPYFTLGTNAMGVLNSLELHRSNDNFGPLIVVTSDKAYRNQESARPYTEDDELFGDDPYSASKSMAEIAVHTYSFSYPGSRQRGLASVRAGNVFGGGDWSANRLVPDCIRQLEESGTISLRMPQAVRPWTYVVDVVFGYLLVAASLMQRPADSSQAWNFASGEVLTVKDVAQSMADAWQPRGEIRFDEQSIGHETTFLQIDAAKARGLLGWDPVSSVRDSLARTASWYLSQSRGGDVCRDSINEINSYWRIYDDRTRRGAHGLRGTQPPSMVP